MITYTLAFLCYRGRLQSVLQQFFYSLAQEASNCPYFHAEKRNFEELNSKHRRHVLYYCQFYVPDLFYIECTNILWKYVRAGQYAAVDIQKDLASLKAFPLNVVSTADLIEDAANIAVKHNISAYDASYIALSNQVDAILLTLDLRLVKNLAATSYNIFSFIDFEIPSLP